jgi:DNA-binding response OmpR family regulator
MNARILVVEDETVTGALLGETLGEEGYHVDLAADGRRALELLLEKPFDLMLLDLKLPHMDGLELLARLTESRTAVPTIIMTGRADVMRSGLSEQGEETVRAYPAPCAYLAKPFRTPHMLYMVERMLKAASRERAD